MPTAVLTAASLGIACAVLSIFVVARRWAFLGEGIAHAGFGGAGTAWLLALLFPALDIPWVSYIAVIIFCLATGFGIGAIHRRRRVNSDAAVGIFLVASLAWGFLAQQVYHGYHHRQPAGWEAFLFGGPEMLSQKYALASLILSATILVILYLLRKEILFYAFDPAMAEVSGVPVGFIHYLLITLITLTIIIGVNVAGSVLVTAMLILPGTTALLLNLRMRGTLAASITIGLLAAITGPLIHAHYPSLPQGPMIVLTLFAEFLLVYAATSTTRARITG